MIPLKERSVFGRGILACKMGKSLKDCPAEFKNERIAGTPKSIIWKEGFIACRDNQFGDMKRHGLYEYNNPSGNIKN